MKIVFLMDPLETVIFEKDTSLSLMLGAHRRGHEVYFVGDGGISIKDGRVSFSALKVTPQPVKEQPLIRGETVTFSGDDIGAVFVRSDPPFDAQYLMNTWLLDRLPACVPVINSPGGIRAVNEKIWATRFTSLIPKTVVSRNRGELLAFIAAEKDVVAKPTDGHGGKSVFRIQSGGMNVNVILETLTVAWTREIVLQKYLAASEQGDKRILLLNGEPLGAVLRVHAEDDHRNNFFSGGKAAPASVDKQDEEIIRVLRPELLRLGLYFVGIDVIGGQLIEVNVTSPTCLQEMNHFAAQHLEDRVIAFAERLASERQNQ
ncbi:MAG: glutathione synthase [Candidatus Omnitrophota bacterium]|nr:glutathione synthase [Candidatus Omnitrophota bacterium]MDZ4242631.1 glutathione synthase [Candidatus Omnitrophota bacterium]